MDGPFPQPNEAVVTFFDEDGYEFKVAGQKPASQGRYATAAAWRATAAPHLQGAIAELERAAMAMPVSREP